MAGTTHVLAPELREPTGKRREASRGVREELRRLDHAQESSSELGKARDGENANGGYGQNRAELVAERRGWDWRGRGEASRESREGGEGSGEVGEGSGGLPRSILSVTGGCHGRARLLQCDGEDGREGRGVQGEDDDEGRLFDKLTRAKTTRGRGARANGARLTSTAGQDGGHHMH
jgi:hypothetical protein